MQLRCCGIAAYKKLMEQGYPARYECDQLLATYDLSLICGRLKYLCLEVLLRSVGMNLNDYKLGNTRVCFRPLKRDILEKILHPKENEIALVKTEYQKKLIVFRRWSNLIKAALKNSSIIARAR